MSQRPPPPPPPPPLTFALSPPGAGEEEDEIAVEDSLRGRSNAYAPWMHVTPTAQRPNGLGAIPPRLQRQPLPAAPPALHPGADASISPVASLSSSFTFAPRPTPAELDARQLFAGAPHTPVYPSARSTVVAPTSLFTPQPTGAANLDMAALAAERRIRQNRAAAHHQYRTPDHSLAHNAFPHAPQPTTSLRNRVPSRLPDLPTANASARGYIDHSLATSISGSMDTMLNPTRLFASPRTDAYYREAQWTARSTGPHTSAASRAERSWSGDPSTSISPSASVCASVSTSLQSRPAAAPLVRLRKWDGSQTSVPSYLISEPAESALEQQLDFDAVNRFNISQLLADHDANVRGQANQTPNHNHNPHHTASKTHTDADTELQRPVDALQAILEIQLGLKGMHGWYGYTYRNPKRSITNKQSNPVQDPPDDETHPRHSNPNPSSGGDGRGRSRKRRRDSSTSSCCSSSTLHTADATGSEDETPIVIYDTFGRVRATLTMPGYPNRGGPRLPLPTPYHSFSLRHSTSSHHILQIGSTLSAQESHLYHQLSQLKPAPNNNNTLNSSRFYSTLITKHAALASFHSTHSKPRLKALQNAYLDSSLFLPRTLPLPHAHVDFFHTKLKQTS